jgi:hypothetical protein
MAKRKRKRIPKRVLKLPDLEHSKITVLNSLPSVSSRRSYDHAIREFIDRYCSEPRLAFNKTVVTRYRMHLEQALYASSTINLRLSAVRRLAYEAADAGLLSPDLAAGLRRVRGAKKHGVRIGNWLTAEQSKSLLAAFRSDTLYLRCFDHQWPDLSGHQQSWPDTATRLYTESHLGSCEACLVDARSIEHRAARFAPHMCTTFTPTTG